MSCLVGRFFVHFIARFFLCFIGCFACRFARLSCPVRGIAARGQEGEAGCPGDGVGHRYVALGMASYNAPACVV